MASSLAGAASRHRGADGADKPAEEEPSQTPAASKTPADSG
jgi:hypothetical protein